MKLLKTGLLLALLLMIAGACATSEDKSSVILKKEGGGEVVHDKFIIRPGGSREECIELRPGMIFDFAYDSSENVDFNVHYHGEKDVYYPVSDKGVRTGKGMIDPGSHKYYTEEQEFYCLMWDNVSDEPARVSFTCVLKQKAE